MKWSVEKVNEMCKLLNYNGRVEGRVVFINPDAQVTIEGVISEFALTRAELVAMLRQMAEQENHTIKANLPPHKLKF